MPKIAVVTDSNSGITVEEGGRLGVWVVPMPVLIDGKIYYEGVDLTQEEFYRRQLAGADIATSQPAPGDVMARWEQALEQSDQLVYLPMSAGLSASCATAQMLAGRYDGRVQVVDNRRISVTQRYGVMDALALARSGMDALQIRQALEGQGDEACIYIAVDTLKYLRKGGRVSGAEAIAGTMLNIKPVLEIRGEKLTPVGKVRGMRGARKLMIQRVRADVEGRLKHLWDSGHLTLAMACSQVPDQLREEWREEIQAAFPEVDGIFDDALTLSIACHIGPGALGIGAVRV